MCWTKHVEYLWQTASFNEVVTSSRSHYVPYANEVVIVQYLLVPVTCRVTCGDSVTECGLTRKGLTLK